MLMALRRSGVNYASIAAKSGSVSVMGARLKVLRRHTSRNPPLQSGGYVHEITCFAVLQAILVDDMANRFGMGIDPIEEIDLPRIVP